MKIKTRRSLSFAGCGFLGIYHVGVAVCLRQHAPQLLLERIAGASAGALAACCLICDLPLEGMAGDFLRVVQETRRHSLGAFSPWFNLPECLLEGMHRRLPPDAHQRVNGRLHISLTRVSDRQNVVMSEFSSREELLQALMCSCFIPGLSGLMPPQIRGVRYMDGALSNNLPLLDEHTVTVSPFCGESDICPRDQSPHLLQLHINWANNKIRLSRRNLRRIVGILLPGRSDFVANFCQQGYDDALHFLHRNSLLKESYRRQDGDMVSWIHKQEEIEAKRKEELNPGEAPQAFREESKDSDRNNNNISKKTQKRQKRNQKKAKSQEDQQVKDVRHRDDKADKEKHLRLVPENHHYYAMSLLSYTWSLLRRVLTAPPLARHMVQIIAGHLGRSLTLCEQPHFDLPPLAEAPSPPPAPPPPARPHLTPLGH
ncbi:patatin-like phospholipase domain-containing protein 3 [Drosophila serrata]|uniref:patatin-like phospholipase domain-containing protein 3 n=1 Tax=Drosophila serrata TaxID=7274 RepID=UPI000A1D09CF|nr:patatin-like phospholipase domain-containing protein 3 [Drosophila serrata]